VVLELVEGAEVAVDGLGEFAGGLAAAVGGEVLPEDGVVGVAAEVEREVLRQGTDLVGVGAVFAGLLQGVEGGVGAGDVGGVVLVVVQLHDLGGDVRLEGVVVVGEVGKLVHSHVLDPFVQGNRLFPSTSLVSFRAARNDLHIEY
jgi:hypothetical protein